MLFHKFGAIFLLIFLSAAASAEDAPAFIPNDPPRRGYSTMDVREAPLGRASHIARPEGDGYGHTLVGRFEEGRLLAGKIILTLADASASPQVFLIDGDREIAVNKATPLPDGRIEFDAGGLYASAVKVTLRSDAPENPVAEIDVQSVVLGGSTRIMLIGDSIASGKFADNLEGYRHILYDRLDGDGYDVDFVGQYGDPPYEGHFQGGEKINDFYPRGLSTYATGEMDVTYSMNQYRPNIVAIHLGTNDLNSETGYAIAPYGDGSDFYDTQIGEMATLIDYLLKWHNGEYGSELEHILVSLIIPIKYRDSVCVEFNLELARLVNDFRTGVITGRPEPVELVDHFSRFREWPGLTDNYYKALMYDSLHPNTAGHELMADVLYESVTHLLTGRQNWFTDVTWTADVMGRDIAYNGDFAVFENQGVAVADVDDDGVDEIYMSRTNSDNPNAHEFLYKRTDGLPYDDATNDFGVADPGGSRGVVFVDIDNDGDYDLFNGVSGARNRLYRNDGGHFVDVSDAAGIADLARVTTGVVAADFDNDGDVDLYAVNSRDKNEMYVNDGDGYFQRQDRGADDRVEPDIPSLSASAADFDNDGDVDIYIVKRGAPNVLFVNDGAGNFHEDASAAGVALDDNSNGAAWGDLDNDGDLDLLVAVTGENKRLHFYENNGDGSFTDRTQEMNIEMSGYSPIVADFDNDGDLDILATQESDYAVYYRNEGPWDFVQRNGSGAEIHGGDIRGAAVFDYDDDGDLDLIAARADMFNVLLQNNLSSSNNFIKIKADGPNGNRGGFGAKLWLYEAGRLNNPDYLIGYGEILSANGHISQSSPVQHFGLGARAACDVLVRFTDGSLFAAHDVAANQTIRVSPSGGQVGNPAHIALYSGDGQQGTVGEDLTEPLVVRVTDAEGQPVPDVDVVFEVTDGDAQLFTTETSNDKISIQAEAGQLSNAMQRVADESASGGFFVMNPVDRGETGSTLMHKEIAADGDYYLWLRIENSGEEQKIRLQIGDDSPITIVVSPNLEWQWIPVDDQSHFLTAGAYDFRLDVFSTTLHVDKLLLVLDAGYQPHGFEDSGDVNATDANGLAQRYVKLGEKSGAVQINASSTFNGSLIPDSPIIFHATANPGPAASMQKSSGDGQTGQPGEPLAEPFVIAVFDALNNPVANVPTTFTILSGGGSLTTDAVVPTDAQGRAKTTLIPGEASSLQQVKAEVADVAGSPVVFEATISGVASEMKFISGDNQSGVVMSALPAPVKVQVLDQDGQPAANYAVTFTALDDGARLSPNTVFDNADSSIIVVTDANGVARVRWRLGEHSGKQYLKINAGSLIGSPMTISADAAPAAPAYLQLISGDGQTGHVNQTLAQPFVVKLRDAWGNAAAGYDVTFHAESSHGSFSGAAEKTVAVDSAGHASAVFTLGRIAGENIKAAEAWAIVDGDAIPGSPVSFFATVLPGEPAFTAKMSGDEQIGVVDSDLEQPFVIRVADAFNNPVPDFTVVFEVVQGDGSLDRSARIDVLTDAQGLAKATYHIGALAGEHRIRALCAGLVPAQHDFTVQALPAEPYALEYVSGDDQLGAVNAALPAPLVARVVDRFGNGVANHSVQWRVTSQGGDLGGVREKATQTDAAGEARVTLTLGAELGDSLYTVEARAVDQGVDLQNSPLHFVASAGVGSPTTLIALTPTSNLIGAANHELPAPVRVKVTDENGLPVAGFQVTFQILAGGGSFADSNSSQLKAVTNADGVAQARWILGALGIEQQMRCMAVYENEHLQNSPLFFKAMTVNSQPQRLVAVSGDDQTGNENTVLNDPLVVQVLDEYDAPYGDHTVVFTVQKGDGLFVESGNASYLTRTSGDGLAQARLKLGADVGPGAYEIKVQSFNSSGLELQGSPLLFTANGAAQRMRIVYGDEQSGVVNTLLPNALKVQITDENNIGIAGVDVIFSKESGDGEFTSNPNPQTNENGIARVQFKLGTKSGRVHIKAAAPALGARVFFNLTALPDEAATLHIVSGNNQTGVAGHALNRELAVGVFDQYGNGVPEIEATFSPQTGHGVVLPSTVLSDSSGLARAQWLLGAAEGEQFVFVVASGLPMQPLVFTATALQNQAPRIVLPDSFTVRENEMLAFTVHATDAEDDTIFVQASGLPTGAVFDVLKKEFFWRPSFEQAGDYTIIFQARDHIGARRMKATIIRVHNVNRKPVISLETSVPRQHQLGRVDMSAAIDFKVVAVDPDSDPLKYLWQVNGRPTSTSDHFRLQAQLLDPGPATVTAFVFDHSDTVSTSWSLEIITAVKFKFFRADFKAYEGVTLTWETQYEWGNLGFYVQRATREKGPYETVSPFIAASEKGVYKFVDPRATGSCYYRLQTVQADGVRHVHEAVHIEPPTPQDFSLHQNYPNPFNPATTIRFDVASRSHVSLRIYDILGRRVKTLADGDLAPGFHKVVWDGKTDAKTPAASGVYYAVLVTEEGRFRQKMLLLR